MEKDIEKKGKRKVQVTMSEEMYQVISEKARISGVSVSGVVGYMLMESIKLEKNLSIVEQFMEMAKKQEANPEE